MKTFTGQKTQRQLIARGDHNCVLTIAGQRFLRYFEGYFELFAVFEYFYVFTPRFLAEPLPMFGGTAVGKHCFNPFNITLQILR
jgi:hypothetical protein